MSTENTPLRLSATRTTPNYQFYGNDTGIHQFYTRRQKDQQLQCLTYVIIIAIFIMAMVVTVSYSINKVDDPLVADSTNPEEVPPSPSLKSAWTQENLNLQISKEMSQTSLSNVEWNEAVQAGQEAITSRIKADALSSPLPAPSPNSRHQYAVKTSLQAGKLALGGIGELAATRHIVMSRLKLSQPSSMGTYFKNIWVPIDTCKEFSMAICPPRKYRNFDGTCNHPRNFGAALTPFIRKLPADYSDGIDLPRNGKYGTSLPSAREISLKVHPPSPSSNPAFTVMLAVFGQFLDHDITATAISQGTNGSSLSCCPKDTYEHPECFPVQVGPGDPVFDTAGRNCMEFVRSAPAPQCKIGPREQLNQVTAFIDGSVIYGPDRSTAQSLREGQNGLLRMFKSPDNRTLLPQSTDPNDGCNRIVESARGRYCFSSGDGRANENLHLTTMHLLWARNHNKMAQTLSELNPTWDDEKIYQETRRIIGAQLQHITYNEFIPIVLGETETNQRKLKPFLSGFRLKNGSAQVNPAIANNFAAAAFRFAHTLLPGLMKVADAEKTKFSYVELHRMLFNPYSLYSKGGMESFLNSATSNFIQKTTTHVTSQLTKHLFEDPLANTSIPCGLDLVSLNIQRGRDHGLPGYTAWRQLCGLGKVQTFDELRGEIDGVALDQISKLYGHVDDVDLYTGALAEINNADGLVGPTFKCLIGDQFSRIQQGDRFWYEVPGEPQSFTEGQLKEIRKTTLAKLICECSDEIYHIQPEVMRSIGPQNPMMSCEDIPDIDLSVWKDASLLPILKASIAAGTPENWLNFQKEINTTVIEIVNFFGKTIPAPGNPDWTTFENWVNKSFTEIRNTVSTLQPKADENVSPNVESKNKLKFVQSLKSEFDKKYQISSEGEELDSGKFGTNKKFPDSIEYLTSETTTTAATYDDWINFKNEIKTILNNELINATGIPTPEQRGELMKRITTEIEEIKKSVISMKIGKLSLMPNETTKKDEESNLYSISMKDDVIKAVTDAIDRVQNEAPAPGDPAWATFGPKIKKDFDGIKYYIPVLPKKKGGQKMGQDSSATVWANYQNSLNKKIDGGFSGINENILAPGEPTWKQFKGKMQDRFIFSNDNSLASSNEPSPKQKSNKELTGALWDNFSNTLNKSINTAVASIAGQNLKPDNPAWAATSKKIMNDVSTFKDNFVKSKKKQVLQSSLTVTDPTSATFWDEFRNSLNESINNAIGGITGKSPPPGDPAWANFGAKIMNNFSGFKDKFAKFHVEPENPKEKALGPKKMVPFDWYTFKTDIINSVTDTVSKIQKNMPLPDSPDWAEFRADIMNGFAKIPSGGATKTSTISGSIEKELNPSMGETFDWVTFKNEIIKSVTDIINKKNITLNLPPGDSESMNFMTKSVKSNVTLQATKSKIGSKTPALEELQFSFLMTDWADFKEKINMSLVDAIDSIKSKSPSPGDPAWVSFKTWIKDEFALLKNEIDFLKANSTSKVPKVSKEAVKTFSDERKEKMQVKTQDNQSLPDFSSDLFSLEGRPYKTFVGLKKTIVGAVTTPFIPATDWISFKREINVTISNFVKALNGTDVEEWKKMKDSIQNSFTELRNEIISIKNNTIIARP